ncbi:MAG: hypothetical protein ABIP48_01510 [Planctomycetota bacterium]
MPVTSHLKVLYLSHLSNPATDRPIYRAIRQRRIQKIVELGVGDGRRAVRMIEVAGISAPIGQVRYTGVDLFEARTERDGPGMPLKTAHRLLSATGAHVKLVPGDPFSALSRVANGLAGTDLVVISAEHDLDSLARAWFYLPRMLAPRALVLMERPCGESEELTIRLVPRDEVDRLAAVATPRRAA